MTTAVSCADDLPLGVTGGEEVVETLTQFLVHTGSCRDCLDADGKIKPGVLPALLMGDDAWEATPANIGALVHVQINPDQWGENSWKKDRKKFVGNIGREGNFVGTYCGTDTEQRRRFQVGAGKFVALLRGSIKQVKILIPASGTLDHSWNLKGQYIGLSPSPAVLSAAEQLASPAVATKIMTPPPVALAVA